MTKIKVKHQQDPLNVEFMQPLFLARKALTDSIVNTSTSYISYDIKMITHNEQIDKLDALIVDLSFGQLND